MYSEKKIRKDLFGSRLPNQYSNPENLFKDATFHPISAELIERMNAEYRELASKGDAEDLKAIAEAAKHFAGD